MSGTIAQLFGAGESECSVMMLWTYALASIAVYFLVNLLHVACLLTIVFIRCCYGCYSLFIRTLFLCCLNQV